MPIDTGLLGILVGSHEESGLDFSLLLQGKSYQLARVSIADSPTPVTRPTVRGGVYFSAKSEYRIRGTVDDLAIVPLLSKTMLGPSTEFGDIQIRTELPYRGKALGLRLHANLTSSVQGPSGIELHMVLVGLEPA